MMQYISSIGHGKYRTLLTLTSSLALFCAVSSASAGALERAKQTGKLTLGYSTETRPYSFKNDAGSPDGYAVELCKRVADAAKAELKLPSLSVNFVTSIPKRLQLACLFYIIFLSPLKFLIHHSQILI